MANYNHQEIEKKWAVIWAKTKLYQTDEDSKKPKFYCLDMFPYPSGAGLHVGHPKGYIATDIFSRLKRMQGYRVLHPMGWDAFGLPTENYAIKHKINPKVAADENIVKFKAQLSKLGFNYDWEREINTTDPQYYKWTQWIFIQLFKKGLAYEAEEPIIWCPSCKTGLSLEDLENGKCERCGSDIEMKPMRQWVLKITEYADRLLQDLDIGDLEWEEQIKEQQRNWIGRSEGAEVLFKAVDVNNIEHDLWVFTTRPDTLFGATFMVVAPEHPLVEKLTTKKQESEVKKYVSQTLKKTDLARQEDAKNKTGVFTGSYAVNPVNGERIPIWIADYVLMGYGHGAIMAVPAHDERDFDFAKKYKIPITPVIKGGDVKKNPYLGDGEHINSDYLNGLDKNSANKIVIEVLSKKKIAKSAIQYRIRDWVFSRQRYWGEPIPIVHCPKCGPVTVPESELPVMLPEVKNYEPTGTGESPLANITDWVNTKCPKCGGSGKRETNTMPQWAGSSWYYLRYIDPKNGKYLIDPKKEKSWMPVDLYVGGIEHATRHLLYARFWHKFLFDQGVVSTIEPFKRLIHVGLILAEDGRKMSKRWGNVINPDHVVGDVGADSLRVYEMFMGPFTQEIAWDTKGLKGSRRFLDKVWSLYQGKIEEVEYAADEKILNQTIKKVGEDIENFRFNTAVSALMVFVNHLQKNKVQSRRSLEILAILLAPFAPYLTEELWEKMGQNESIHLQSWPSYDPAKIIEEMNIIAVQVNGKVRGELELNTKSTQEDAMSEATKLSNVKKFIGKNKIKKVIYVPGKILNIVV